MDNRLVLAEETNDFGAWEHAIWESGAQEKAVAKGRKQGESLHIAHMRGCEMISAQSSSVWSHWLKCDE